MAYDRIVPKPSQLSQSPLMPGHLGQTLVSDMTFYCRPDVVGSLDSRESRSNCLFCFYGSAHIVIRPKRYLYLHKFKIPEFKNTASLNGFFCKRGIRPARTEQFLVIYVNDIVKAIKHSSCKLYADDLVLYIDDVNPVVACVKLQDDVNSL